MTDKIKSFFQKKKVNAKFMNAGKGYKLTESSNTSSASAREEKEPVKRLEPTEEAKVAGQAALARLEAKKTDITKFNTSYAAIQMRVKKELELERKAKEAQEKSKLDSNKVSEELAKDISVLAVTDVYFRCPYLSEEVLTRDEWRKKIRDFLYEQLTEEEAGLTACLIIQNCNHGKEKIQNCVDTLGKYVDNILNNPEVEKYWKIRMSNRIFQEKVLPVEGALEFLKAAGFRQKRLLNDNDEEDFLVWSPDNCSIENVSLLAEALRSAEQIPLELDRNIQVLLPSQANERNELPYSFFSISPEEIKREQQLRSEAIERSQMLMTKAMREKEERRELRKYKFSLIRIKFPDNIILQGTFSVHEKFQDVIDFVRENLANTEISFSLIPPTGQKFSQECFDKTLLELKLIPAVVLIFSVELNEKKQIESDSSKGYLKEEILVYVQST